MKSKSDLQKIGIRDSSFELFTVEELIAEKVIERPIDGNHGEIHPTSEDFVASGVPFVMATDINNGRVNYDACSFITPKQADSLRKGFARNGDVLVTHKASIGRTAIVQYDEHPYVMLTPQVTYYRVLDPRRLNNHYLRYYFDSELFQKTMHFWADSGSTRAYLGITAQHKLPVIVPPIDTQRKIAAVLAAYDDLIEANRRRIALLERMAEEIYREWFVRLRFPGHATTKITKGIPAGWRVAKLGELATTQYGFTASATDQTEGPKLLRITDIVPETIDWGSVPHCRMEESEEQKYLLREGDIVIARTGATVGYAKRINKLHPRAVFASYLVRVVPNSKVDGLFLGTAIQRQAFKEFIWMFVTGAAQPQANATTMSLFPVLYPGPELLERYNVIMQPIVDQKELLTVQADHLTRTRDLLLPRLISGKLPVESLPIAFPPSMANAGE